MICTGDSLIDISMRDSEHCFFSFFERIIGAIHSKELEHHITGSKMCYHSQVGSITAIWLISISNEITLFCINTMYFN